jgi:hypothetical protein
MAAMTAPGRFDHLRHAALDMLDAGNSMAAVSKVLAVPVPVIARWREEPVPPAGTAPRHADAPARGLRFPTTLVVRRGFPHAWMRHVAIGYGLVALTVGLLAWTLRDPGSLDDVLEIDLTALAACAWWWFQRDRPLLMLGSDAIVVPRWLGRAAMPYADLADWWLVLHVRNEGSEEEVEGRLLTLHSRRAGVRPIEVFVHDHVEIDPEVTERLDLAKQANAGPGLLTPLHE